MTTPPFAKILIANRGEIACRIMRTAQRLGIATVAVHSDADREALHVRSADEAVRIGPAPSADSYLVIERIVEACRATGAEAVHPGYGFLAENPACRRALDDAGIVFIGPSAEAMAAMGDKITSKRLARAAAVNTVKGSEDGLRDADHAVEVAGQIGYPVMLKASAGGGGKGMRVVNDDDECREGFERATNEARSSFGDDRVFAEKFIEDPRHIEIQVLADQQGNTIHLGERECSIQRRHQKVIEEAPSPFLDEATRAAMGAQAVALARAVGYASAGTVEFIVGTDRSFYFLEMNTRLQVEHPVTEMVTGLDLVELMIRVAAGEPLPLTQEDVRLQGWSLEARIYAEDPLRGFMPSIGRLAHLQPPKTSDDVRVDTGVVEGSEISLYYDPLIAKLITHGDTRDQAIARMGEALDRYHIRGVAHNISFLNALIAHPRFGQGRLSTGFIDEEYPDGFHAADVPLPDPALPLVAAAYVHRRQFDRAARLTGQLPSLERRVRPDWVVVADGEHHPVAVTMENGAGRVDLSGRTYRIASRWRLGDPLLEADIDGRHVCFQLDSAGPAMRLSWRGATTTCLVLTPRAAELRRHMLEKKAPDLSRFLLSPMPGLLVRLAVAEGDEIKAGEELAVVEAMKMENSLRATSDVVVSKVCAAVGDSLVVDQPILEFGERDG